MSVDPFRRERWKWPFSYVGNSPIVGIDPSGLKCWVSEGDCCAYGIKGSLNVECLRTTGILHGPDSGGKPSRVDLAYDTYGDVKNLDDLLTQLGYIGALGNIGMGDAGGIKDIVTTYIDDQISPNPQLMQAADDLIKKIRVGMGKHGFRLWIKYEWLSCDGAPGHYKMHSQEVQCQSTEGDGRWGVPSSMTTPYSSVKDIGTCVKSDKAAIIAKELAP